MKGRHVVTANAAVPEARQRFLRRARVVRRSHFQRRPP
ncbi:hypothetical protein PSAB6_240006 [Paraburkholderia sabiae]|nr:hypothetical protein PSAB6_240006 [Paraburkholderia sabiae]